MRQNITVLDYYNAEQFKDLKIDAIYISGGNTLLKRLIDLEIAVSIKKS